MKVIGYQIRTTIKDNRNQTEVPAFWDRYLEQNLGSRIPNAVNRGTELGICMEFNSETGTFAYVIGMEVDCFDNAEPDMVCVTIPKSQYAVFTTSKVLESDFVPSIHRTWNYIFDEWFPTSGYRHAGTPEIEINDERLLNKQEMQMEIWIPVL